MHNSGDDSDEWPHRHAGHAHRPPFAPVPQPQKRAPHTAGRPRCSAGHARSRRGEHLHAIRCNHAGHARSEVIRGHQRSSELACRTRSIAQRAASRCLAAPVTRRACCTCGTPIGRRGEHLHARQVISGNLVAISCLISCCTWNSFPWAYARVARHSYSRCWRGRAPW